MMRFDKFTQRAQEAAMRAFELMQQHSHTQVDVEHIFLAMLDQQESLVADILERLNAPLQTFREKLEENLQHTPRTAAVAMYQQSAVAQVFITPALKRVIDRATEEAKHLKDEFISTAITSRPTCSARRASRAIWCWRPLRRCAGDISRPRHRPRAAIAPWSASPAI
jgi:ATP-dependent Clp protease ATP-binding subunit ClpA